MSEVPDITSLAKKASAASKALPVVNLGQVLSQMVDAADQWVKVIQEESTRREEIRAWEATERERIVAQRDVLLRGLELTHDERRENFRRLFDNLDVAMRNDDAATAASLLDSITELAKSSPFKDLANVEFVVNELKQPDRTWKMQNPRWPSTQRSGCNRRRRSPQRHARGAPGVSSPASADGCQRLVVAVTLTPVRAKATPRRRDAGRADY